MVDAVLVQGVPDDGMARLAFTGRGAPTALHRGTASFAPFLGETFRAGDLWLGPPRGPFRLQAPRAPLVNYIADADLCGIALEKASMLVERTGLPCFNHPAAVLRTRRDAVAVAAAGVPGLVAPRTIRVQAVSLTRLAQTVESAGLRYPVLVRVAGDHGGVSLTKVARAVALGDVLRAGLIGRTLYVTEYRDFRSGDGRYRKYRLAMVGGRPLLRHVIVGEGWLLHAERRLADSAKEEADRIERFDAEQLPAIAGPLAAIDARLGLDWFGIDCGVEDDGTVVLFEANACMNVLQNLQPSPNMWDRPIARIRDALLDLLARPADWRGAPA